MSRGSISRRGLNSWRLKFEGGRINGKRQTRYVTFRGTRIDAQRELTRLLASRDSGAFVEPTRVTVADHLRAWLGQLSDEFTPSTPGLSPKTAERYRQLAEQQIYSHLGEIPLQKLRPAKVREWHEILLASGGKGGRRLSARTVGHAHRVLHRALERAVETEILWRNVSSVVRPPRVEELEVQILDAERIALVTERLEGHPLFPVALLVLGTGLRRGEALALRWSDCEFDRALIRVERSLEETNAGLRFKVPKTRHSKRRISVPPAVIAILREHRRRQLELRLFGKARAGGVAVQQGQRFTDVTG